MSHAQHLDVGREGAAVEHPGQRTGLALGEGAGDRHRVGERRLAHDRGRLDDVVEHDRQLVAGAGVGAVVALGGERVPARRARAAEADVDGPALLLAELHAGAVALEDLVAGAAGRPDDALAAVDLAQDGGVRDRSWPARSSARSCRPGRCCRGPPWSAASTPRSSRDRWSAARRAPATTRPASRSRPAVTGVEPTARGAGRRRAVRRRAGHGRPGDRGAAGRDDVLPPSAGGRRAGAGRGRSVTMPATSTASSASRWSLTPGRSTTRCEPSTRTSGSAMPRFSSSSRIRSRMTSRSSLLAPSVGASDDGDAALQVEPEDRGVAEGQVEQQQDDGDPDAAEQRCPEAAAGHSLVSRGAASLVTSASSDAVVSMALVSDAGRSGRWRRPCPGRSPG